jgi:hypothetical protein
MFSRKTQTFSPRMEEKSLKILIITSTTEVDFRRYLRMNLKQGLWILMPLKPKNEVLM